jgi:hypothetical protein
MKKIELEGIILTPGDFVGNPVYVRDHTDLENIDKNSLAILDSTSKSVSIAAMKRAGATIKIGDLSLTSHLVLCAKADHPFSVVENWPYDTVPAGSDVQIDIKVPENGATGDSLKQKKALFIDQSSMGQKAARLYKLSDVGFKVPSFQVIDYATVAQVVASAGIESLVDEYLRAVDKIKPADHFEIASKYSGILKQALVDGNSFDLEGYLIGRSLNFPIAVRSCASIEDLTDDAMAGVFDSLLNVGQDNVADSVLSVISSMFNDEVLYNYPELIKGMPFSVILQEMVQRPYLAGTVFLRSPDNSGMIILEGVCNKYADEMMSGELAQDVRVLFTSDLKEAKVASIKKGQEAPEVITMAHRVCSEALEIYHQTGCDDLEYCVDLDRQVYWLQARPLTYGSVGQVRETFRGFDFKKHFANTLNFRIYESNRIAGLQLHITGDSMDYDLEEGLVLGDEGIIQRCNPNREVKVHDLVAADPSYIAALTEFGNQSEERIRSAVEDLGNQPIPALYSLLTLHAGVRNGSYGFRSRHKAKFNEGVFEGVREEWLREFVGNIVQASDLDLGIEEAVNLLYLPQTTSSIMQQRSMVQCYKSMELGDGVNYWDFLLYQLREVPDLSSENIEDNLPDDVLRAELGMFNSSNLVEASETLRDLEQGYSVKADKRQRLIEAAKQTLGEDEYARFIQITDFLTMKGTTNESHPYYRGKIFLKIGKELVNQGIKPSSLTYPIVRELFGFDKEDLHFFDMKRVLD